MTSNRWQRRRLVRIVLAAAVACAAWAALAPAGARANYSVSECNARVGNTDAVMIRPFGGATKISQTDTAGTGAFGWRRTDRALQHLRRLAVDCAAKHDLQDRADHRFTTTPHGGYGPMTSGSGSPGYSAVVGSPAIHWVTPVQSNTKLLCDLRAVFRKSRARALPRSHTSRTSMRRFRISLHPQSALRASFSTAEW